MRQLNANDAAFIYSDTAHANSNVSLLHIYDQTTAPKGVVRFKQILAIVENRLSQFPVLRQKVLRVPLDLDYPYWVEDEHFDIEYHVRHIALPKPGDWRQFCIQAARIHARPLDLQRPLWEMYVIEGLDSFLDLPAGSFAVLLKIHHSAVDVASGHLITALLHDVSANTPDLPPPAPWFPQESPGSLALMWRAGFHAVTFPLRMVQPVTKGFGWLSLTFKTLANEFFQIPGDFPMTRFNTVVSARRVFDTRRFPLSDFRKIRGLVDGATVNDVVLAVCAGGLRRYLAKHGELPQQSMVAAAPISVQGSGEEGVGDSYAWARVDLFTQIEDPVQRLQHIRQLTASSEVMGRALSARELTDITRHAPSAALSLSSKMLRSVSAQLGGWVPLANCNITNVPGPQQPLYLAGARLNYLSAIMPITDGMGLVFSVTSYNDTLVISLTGCYEQLPDPQTLAQCLRDSFQAYLEAANALNAVVATRKPRLPRSTPKRVAKKPRV